MPVGNRPYKLGGHTFSSPEELKKVQLVSAIQLTSQVVKLLQLLALFLYLVLEDMVVQLWEVVRISGGTILIHIILAVIVRRREFPDEFSLNKRKAGPERELSSSP